MRPALGLALGLALAAPSPAQPVAPVVAVLGTCSALTSNIYPADSVNWFDPVRHSQVVFFAHLLFPLPTALPTGPWHPPLSLPAPGQGVPPPRDEHYAEAEWLDPAGRRVALYGLTFPARVRSDWLDLHGRTYIPHTLAMAIGIRDLRSDAGQVALPSQEGQYTVHLRVDGRATGLAFFRMLRGQAPTPVLPRPAPQAAPELLSPAAR